MYITLGTYWIVCKVNELEFESILKLHCEILVNITTNYY